MDHIHTNRKKGAAMLVMVIFFVFISVVSLAGIVTPSVREFRIASNTLHSKQAYFLAESGIEDAIYRIRNGKQISVTENISSSSDTATTTITSIGGSQKVISTLGISLSHERKITAVLGTGDGIIFKYGTQSGEGGIVFANNSFLNGNLYSNGDIVGSNGAYITGSAHVAGSSGSISNMRIGYGGTADAHAHTVTDSTVTGTIYCQSGSLNNKTCNQTQSDPEAVDLPIKDIDITTWKNDALTGSTLSGNQTISTPTTLGPVKIVGNLTVNSTLTIANTIWVTGDVIINSTVKLASSYGANSGIIIADGLISVSNGVVFQDSGTTGSYIMLLSTSTCDSNISTSPCNSNNAIEISNNSNIVIANAQVGTVYFSNNATVKEVVGKTIRLKNNVGITYGSGLINVDFTSGPAGSWSISSWQEAQ
jgi:hypothetical protein